jgi:hypothetical protein
MEIGNYPKTDNSCTIWKSVFTSNGTSKGMKDYRFCRGCGPEDLYIDEGNDVTIKAWWISDLLSSPFKYMDVFAVSNMRIRGDILEEEIIITEDNPAIPNIVVSVKAISIHRMTMKKIA